MIRPAFKKLIAGFFIALVASRFFYPDDFLTLNI